MKAKIDNKDLKAALAKLSSIPGGGSGLHGNSIVTIDADEFSGITIARTTITSAVRILVPGEVMDSGKLALPYLSLASAASTCEGEEIVMQDKHGELTLKSKEDERTVKILKNDELIPMPQAIKGKSLVIGHKEFMDCLGVCAVAIADSDVRPNIFGLSVRAVKGGLQLFGTNGHRVHLARIAALISRIDPEPDSERDYGILIPPEGVECIKKVFGEEKADFRLTFSTEGVQIGCGETFARIPISGERAPFIETMLNPPSSFRTKMLREPLLKAVRAVKPTSDNESVRLFISKVNVRVSACSAEATANRTVPCEGDGEGQFILKAKYLMDCLAAIRSESITMVFAEKSFSVQDGEYDFFVLFQSLASAPKPK